MRTICQSWGRIKQLGGVTFLAGAGMVACLFALVCLPDLRGQNVVVFLSYFLLAGAAYTIAVGRLKCDCIPLTVLWGFAVLFRLTVLATSPSLSDDIYRYIWDGHLMNQGVNPYLEPVDSPTLDVYAIPERDQVNHAWMASPYLPVAQAYFAVITWISPGSTRAFQISAVLLDAVTGLLVMILLGQKGIRSRSALIYLWNPLVVVEFAQGAHVDAFMIFLIMVSLYFALQDTLDDRKRSRWLNASVITLAAATLTKGLPILLVPLLLRRWGWRRLVVYGISLAVPCTLFAAGAGWGMSGSLDGKGLFGALRIYLSYWNFNSSLYHWLEVGLTGYQTAGGVPVEVVGEGVIRFARLLTSGVLALIVLWVGLFAWRRDNYDSGNWVERDRRFLRLATIPLGAYLLLTPTLHPWYVTLLLPVIPFLYPAENEKASIGRFIWPWITLSITVALSYLTYIDPSNPREVAPVRWVEYYPLYFLLVWAAWPRFMGSLNWISRQGGRSQSV